MHLMDPRSVVPQSNMPSYHWLADETLDARDIQARMRVLQFLGDPYSDAEIAAAPVSVAGKTKMDALVAYLQGLGIKNEPQPASAAVAKPAGGAP
jgi:cytochrome c oxidase cbb3-type subunit 2